jgi:hypothetical protein
MITRQVIVAYKTNITWQSQRGDGSNPGRQRVENVLHLDRTGLGPLGRRAKVGDESAGPESEPQSIVKLLPGRECTRVGSGVR